MPSSSPDLKDLVVRAGAGAGKTTDLTHRVLEHARLHKEQSGHWPKMAVTTFTRKATQELRERLLKLALEKFPDTLDFVRSSHLLTVSTMHGLMDRFLRAHGLEMGLSPQFVLVGKSDAETYKRRVLRRILKETPEFGSVLRELKFNELLKFLKKFRQRPYTGKDWSPLKAKDQEAFAWNYFGDFCDSVTSIAERILDESPPPPWEMFAEQLKDWPGEWTGRSWSEVEADALDSILSVAKPRKNSRADSPAIQELSDEYQKLIQDFKKKFPGPTWSPGYWAQIEEYHQVFERLSARFETELESLLQADSKLLLEDLETQALKLIAEFPATATEFGRRWDYWLIDEYQDTSPIQVKILGEWIGDAPRYVVGDPQQSIYQFRGARSEVFVETWEQAKIHGSTKSLQKNYRSDPELLEFINWSTRRMGPDFEVMDPKAPPQKGGPVALMMTALDEEEEWLQIKSQIFQLLDVEKVRPDQICILARVRKGLTDLAARLQECGLPFYLHGGADFLRRRAVQDVLQVLKFILNPWDDRNLLALLRSPWVGCADLKIQEAVLSPGASLWEKITKRGATWPEVQLLTQLLEERKERDLKTIVFEFCRERFVFATAYAVDPSGLREANLLKAFHWIENFLRRPGVNLLEVFQAAQELELEDQQESDAVSTMEPNRIQLMTFHTAKGLEADYVFMPFLHSKSKVDTWHSMTLHDESSLWGFRMNYMDSESAVSHPAELDWVRIGRDRQLKEERRIFYVGLTRAKKKLFLSWQTKPDGAPKESGPANLYYDQDGELTPLPPEAAHLDRPSEQEAARIGAKLFTSDLGAQGEDPGPWQDLSQDPGSQKTSVTREISTGYRPKEIHSLQRTLETSVRGERVHRLFELLKISDAKTMQKYLAQWFDQDPSVLEAVEFLRTSEKPPIGEILQNGEAEWSFLVEWGEQVLEGQLDLFGRDGQGRLWVVDYKSGSTAYKEKAFEQLKIYAQALVKVGRAKDEKVYLCALYPFEKKAFIEELTL